MFAFTALSMLPALAFFALAQRRIAGGLSGLAGSIRADARRDVPGTRRALA